MENFLDKLTKIRITPRIYQKLPEAAGVYIFLKNGTPIYIGKAINLKRRVSSYFDFDLEIKTSRMVSEAKELSFVLVESELEALLLEAKLIRKYMPKYNIAAKDDKHPLYIQITKDKFPRIITVRKIDINANTSIANYGPFPSSANVRVVLKMIRRIFPYSDHKLGKRGCLYSHIGLCNPCPNEIVQSTKYKVLRKKYIENIKHIKSILDGKIDKVRSVLVKQMDVVSGQNRFEEAGQIRDQIERVEYITRPQLPTDFYIQNPNLYEDIRKKELSDLKVLLTRRNLVKSDFNLNRIECFDVAHLGGTNTTASMVTFMRGEANKKFYRHFRIRQSKGDSDTDSMKEVIARRIKHLDDWGKPDLIIVDGSSGQVQAFQRVLKSSNIKIPVVGIAKNPDRLVIGDQKIKLQGNVLHLIGRIRDEAHRFARRYHHLLVSKDLIG